MDESLKVDIEKSKLKKVGSKIFKNPKIHPYKIYKQGILRTLTTPFRVLPDFINIGASKCGTTSLYHFLIQHPNVHPAITKELNYFIWYPTAYYRANFPTVFKKYFEKKIGNRSFVTGEATPLYMFYPSIAKKIQKMNPKIKLIVLLRNPIDRAFSQYSEHFKLGYHNSLTFDEVIKKELNIIEKIKNFEDEKFMRKNIFKLNLSRGIYFEQLKKWMAVIPKDQFLILKTEEFNVDKQKIMNQVFNFLKLPKYSINILKKHNVGKYTSMNSSTRKFLIDFFKPHNKRLYKFLKRDFDWDK